MDHLIRCSPRTIRNVLRYKTGRRPWWKITANIDILDMAEERVVGYGIAIVEMAESNAVVNPDSVVFNEYLIPRIKRA